MYHTSFLCSPRLERRSVLTNVLCHTRTFPDSQFHLCLCFPLSISFLCAAFRSRERRAPGCGEPSATSTNRNFNRPPLHPTAATSTDRHFNRPPLRPTLCFPLSMSFLCAFLSSLGSALMYHKFPLQPRLERRSALKKICAMPGPSRTVGVRRTAGRSRADGRIKKNTSSLQLRTAEEISDIKGRDSKEERNVQKKEMLRGKPK